MNTTVGVRKMLFSTCWSYKLKQGQSPKFNMYSSEHFSTLCRDKGFLGCICESKCGQHSASPTDGVKTSGTVPIRSLYERADVAMVTL